MTIHIEVRKIEPAFGDDRWEIRFGDIKGSTDMHNITRAQVIKAFIDELETELNSETSHNSRKNQLAKPKVTILDNNPLSIASFMEDNPDVKL